MAKEIKRVAGLRVPAAPDPPPPPKLEPKLLEMWGCPVEGCSSLSPVKERVQEHIDKHHLGKADG